LPVTAPAVGNPLQEFYETPGVPLRSGPDRARRQAAMLAEVLRDSAGPAVIVDVGCGDGSALAITAAQNPAHRFAGIDWSADALRQARALGLTVLRGGVALPVADGAADVVIMSELIEHLVDPDGAVAEARRVLRPGGSLLLSTPNLAAWYNRGLLALGVQPIFSEVSLRGVYGRPGSVVAGHLRLFTRRALTEFLAVSGFRCVTVTGARYHGVPRPLGPLDQAFCRWPSAASILLVHARKVLVRRWPRHPVPRAPEPEPSMRPHAGGRARRSSSAAWPSGWSSGWPSRSAG
jgi:SAM-dependent methyltransferase